MPKTAKQKTVKAVKAWGVLIESSWGQFDTLCGFTEHTREGIMRGRGRDCYKPVRVEIRLLSPKPRSKR